MAKPSDVVKTLKARIDRRTKIAKKLSSAQLKQIGSALIIAMKASIKRGLSPIQSAGRFPAYKNPSKYPGKFHRKRFGKRPRPVNLHLSGDFLKDLQVIKVIPKTKEPIIRIGFKTRLSKKKEQGHREGAKGQRKRPIIPLQDKERFSDAIYRAGQRILNGFIKR